MLINYISVNVISRLGDMGVSSLYQLVVLELGIPVLKKTISHKRLAPVCVLDPPHVNGIRVEDHRNRNRI